MLDPIVFRELPVIQEIIADETRLEGERRGCRVSAGDPVVRENVCLVVLRIGAALCTSPKEEPAAAAEPATIASLPSDHHPHAACG